MDFLKGGVVEYPKVIIESDPNDSWAEVELYRWQYGRLPNAPGHEEQKLDISQGLHGMANAIEKGDEKNFPSLMNVIFILRYAAKKLKEANENKNKTSENS